MLCLSQCGAVVWAFKDLTVEVDTSFESRCMIWSLSDARIRRQVETASLCKLLQLVLVHIDRLSKNRITQLYHQQQEPIHVHHYILLL